MASARWRAASRELAKLRRQFLPDPFDPLGIYPNAAAVRASTRAFLVLSHAEIETYLEEWAKDIAKTAELRWRKTRRVTLPLAYMFATIVQQFKVPSRDAPQELADACEKLFQLYYKRIKDNHGIKEDNVLTLLSPLGVPVTAMSATLLPNLNSFGELRGEHAHHSSKAVQNALDPETEHNKLMGIMADLITLDEWLLQYKRAIR